MAEDPLDAQDALSGRRERNKQRVRNDLYNAALKLFTEKGYDHTSVDEIAEDADVARGTFFNHFPRKEDLISAWGDERRARLLAALEATRSDEPTTLRMSLHRCMGLLSDITTEQHAVTRAMLRAWARTGHPLQEEPYLSNFFATLVEVARQKGEIPCAVDPLRVGYLLCNVFLGTLYRWIRAGDKEVELRTELLTACDIILQGISYHGQDASSPLQA